MDDIRVTILARYLVCNWDNDQQYLWACWCTLGRVLLWHQLTLSQWLNVCYDSLAKFAVDQRIRTGFDQAGRQLLPRREDAVFFIGGKKMTTNFSKPVRYELSKRSMSSNIWQPKRNILMENLTKQIGTGWTRHYMASQVGTNWGSPSNTLVFVAHGSRLSITLATRMVILNVQIDTRIRFLIMRGL